MNFDMLHNSGKCLSQAGTTPRCHRAAMSKQVSVKICGYDKMIGGNI